MSALLAVAPLAVALLGCDVGVPDATSETRGLDTPPLQVLSVSITTSYAAGAPVHAVLSGGETNIPTSASIRINFDRYLLPSTARRQAVCVHPDTVAINSIADCTAPNQPFEAVEYNPVLQQVILRLPTGSELAANATHRISIFPPLDDDSFGFRAFDNAPLLQGYTYDFDTGDGSNAEFEALPSEERFCDIYGEVTPNALFGACAFGQCHAAGGNIGAIAMGLDLFNFATIADTATGQTAHGSQQGEAAQLPDQAPRRFGRAMPIIDSQDPGNSYLMYKLLTNFLNHPRTNGLIDPVLGLEIDRMRAGVITGLPMPAEFFGTGPQGFLDLATDPDGSQSFAQMLLVNDWIAAGMPQSCP